MQLKHSAFVFVGVVAAYSLSLLSVKHVAAQDDQRNLRVQQTAPTERRVALIIGNGAYTDSPLINPVNDARDMDAALRGLGFEVIFGENLSQNEMKRNIRAFGEKIRDGGVGLFYYAGHGMQVKGGNYLIPVGAAITTEEEVEYESVNVGLVLAHMEAARNRLNIVILDACRNNPFARNFRSTQKGLASIDAPGGTLIAYSTAPGSVASDGTGRNGLYTQELLKYLKESQLSIEQVFKQVRASVRSHTEGKQIPWESSSLEGDFYFSTSAKSNSLPPSDPAVIELSFWESIKNSSDKEDYKEYLAKYPSGTFAGLARNKIRSLEAVKPLDIPAGTQLNLRLASPIDTKYNRVGDRFIAKVITLGLYEGAKVEGHIATLKKSEKVNGRTELSLAFDNITLLDEKRADIAASLERIIESETVKETDAKGNVRSGRRSNNPPKELNMIGGAKGAVLGAVIGSPVGAGTVYINDNKNLLLEPGTELVIRTERKR